MGCGVQTESIEDLHKRYVICSAINYLQKYRTEQIEKIYKELKNLPETKSFLYAIYVKDFTARDNQLLEYKCSDFVNFK